VNYFFVISISFIIVFLVTPSIRSMALRFYAIDKKDKRKIHNKIITKLGGMGIYLGLLGGISTLILLESSFFRSEFYPLSTLLVTTTLMLVLGVYDDFHGSSAILKFIVQIIISFLIVKSGFLLSRLFIPGLIDIKLGILSIPLTLLWLVGVTNAVNLIDGLDGLASGIVGIVSIFVFIFGLILNDSFVIYISLALAGACFAFLKYNFYPAKIFMGDTGSLFLGLTIAYLGICKSPSNLQNIYFIPVVILLAFPILDTIFAIARRVLRKRNIFSGDLSHIHHFLIKKGFNQAQVSVSLYLLTFILGIISLLVLISLLRS